MNRCNIGDLVEIKGMEGMTCEIIQATIIRNPCVCMHEHIFYLVINSATGCIYGATDDDIISKIEEPKHGVT